MTMKTRTYRNKGLNHKAQNVAAIVDNMTNELARLYEAQYTKQNWSFGYAAEKYVAMTRKAQGLARTVTNDFNYGEDIESDVSR